MRTRFPISDIIQIDCRKKSSVFEFSGLGVEFPIRMFICDKDNLLISKEEAYIKYTKEDLSAAESDRIAGESLEKTLLRIVKQEQKQEIKEQMLNAVSAADAYNLNTKEVDIDIDKFHVIPHHDIESARVVGGILDFKRVKLTFKNSNIKEIVFAFMLYVADGPRTTCSAESKDFVRYLKEDLI